jgi:hypothetical protein
MYISKKALCTAQHGKWFKFFRGSPLCSRRELSALSTAVECDCIRYVPDLDVILSNPVKYVLPPEIFAP